MCTKGNYNYNYNYAVVVDLLKAQLLSENKELQLLGSEDWVIALQAASSIFSEQDQQSLFDMLKSMW